MLLRQLMHAIKIACETIDIKNERWLSCSTSSPFRRLAVCSKKV